MSSIEEHLKELYELVHQTLNKYRDLNQNLTKKNNELEKALRSTQTELDKYRNSRAVGFVTFIVWRIPKGIRRRLKKPIYSFARWLYKRLMPFPRIIRICAKVNEKLRIIKDIQVVLMPIEAKQPKNNNKSTQRMLKEISEINVAMILDEFSYNSFSFECNAYSLEPTNWKSIFEDNEIDLFFCESAWTGKDSLKRPWRGQIYSSINFAKENRTELLDILKYCKEHRIPTVFWNKEDPTHYEDKIHNFVDTALLFDHIFTTSIECVTRYKKEYHHPNVHLLMFATQPRLFNPIEKYERTEEIIFAGSWYNQHSARCLEMEHIFDSILKSGYSLKIYDRQSENSDPNHTFPDRFLPYVHPRLPHDSLDVAYKGSKYALNLNTVTQSQTMFARRVFELMSSGTLVITNRCKGMEYFFGDNLVYTDDIKRFDLSNAETRREWCLYNALKFHTYQNRFQQILDDIDFPYIKKEKDLVTIIYKISSIEEAEAAVENFYQVEWERTNALLTVDKYSGCDILQKILISFQGGNILVISQDYLEKEGLGYFLDGGYFIEDNKNIHKAFIPKAMLHYRYLDATIPIAKAEQEHDKYKMVIYPEHNCTLYPASMADYYKQKNLKVYAI